MIPTYEKLTERLQVNYLEDIPKNFFFSPHIHDELEIHYSTRGSSQYTIGTQTFQSCEKECIIIFPRQLHAGICIEPASDCAIFVNRCLTGAFQHTFAHYRPSSPRLPASSLSPEVELAFEKIQTYYTQKNFLLSHAWLQVLLANLIPFLELEEYKPLEDEDLSFQIIYYLTEHFQEPLTLEQTAKQLHINKYYLSHFFSANLHMTFLQYLTELRIEYVMNALLSTEKNLTQIWQDAGFSSQQTFNRAFRHRTNMTPSEYRKTLQSHHFYTSGSLLSKK